MKIKSRYYQICPAWGTFARSVLPVCILGIMLGAGHAFSQDMQVPTPGPAVTQIDSPPFRVEFGGYQYWLDHGLGEWRGANAEFWIRKNSRFTPALIFDSQTRREGTQQNYAFLSYLNWSRSFYTVQSISGAPQKNDGAVFFPKIRFDIRGNWIPTSHRNLVPGVGFTHFDFGTAGKGQIYNAGALYYKGKFIVQGTLFVNRLQPGNFWSTSGSMSLQYGTEGRYWVGASASGGQELYRIESQVPLEVNQTSYTLDAFYRRWLSRHVGFHVSGTYQEKLTAYRRGGASVRWFFEF